MGTRVIRVRRANRGGRVLVVALVVSGLVACDAGDAGDGGDGGGAGADDESTNSAMSSSDAADVLLRFHFDDAQSQYMLHDNRGDPAVVAAARESLQRGATGDELWAATFVWVNEGDDPEPLLALLDDEEVTIRVMAATGLVARGRAEGFPVLIEALTDDSALVGHEPPEQAWHRATTVLMRFTGQGELGPPLDADNTQRAAAQERWRNWLADSGDNLTFDAEAFLWRTT
jgi:hypothetical protein